MNVRRPNARVRSSTASVSSFCACMELTMTRSAARISWSDNVSKAMSSSWIVQLGGHSAATVISPSGGITDFSGTISSTPSNPQKEGGKRGQINSTLRFGPSGG